jgi:hypothetical protein
MFVNASTSYYSGSFILFSDKSAALRIKYQLHVSSASPPTHLRFLKAGNPAMMHTLSAAEVCEQG